METNKGDNPLNSVFSNIENNYCETESSASGFLARFWREIIIDRKINIVKISSMLNDYLKVLFFNKPPNASSNARGSYNKKLSDPRMSWGTFLEALGVIGVCKIKFTVELTYVDDTVSTHSTNAQIMTDDQRLRLLQLWMENKGDKETDLKYLAVLEELEAKIKKHKDKVQLKKSDKVKR